jgi:hypothetical protein
MSLIEFNKIIFTRTEKTFNSTKIKCRMYKENCYFDLSYLCNNNINMQRMGN